MLFLLSQGCWVHTVVLPFLAKVIQLYPATRPADEAQDKEAAHTRETSSKAQPTIFLQHCLK